MSSMKLKTAEEKKEGRLDTANVTDVNVLLTSFTGAEVTAMQPNGAVLFRQFTLKKSRKGWGFFSLTSSRRTLPLLTESKSPSCKKEK